MSKQPRTWPPDIKPGQKFEQWVEETLAMIAEDQNTMRINTRKSNGKKGDTEFSSGQHHIMQPVYHSLNFRDKKRPA